MGFYPVRDNANSYGHAIGIILVDVKTSFIPGDVGNASTYSYPVLYRTAPGVTLTRLIKLGDRSLLPSILEAAQYLVDHGVRAISSDCGYMIRFQKEVSEQIAIPTLLSSLVMLPTLQKTIPPHSKIGILCASKQYLTPDLLSMAGVEDMASVVIQGMEHCAAFRQPILDEMPLLDAKAIEIEITTTAREMIKNNPEISVILLECSNMPPYARAIQQATGRMVFDYISLIDFFYGASFRRAYTEGFY